MKLYAIIGASALAASACVPIQPEIFHASATGGDFSLLNCGQLNLAEGSVRQRLTSLEQDGVYSFGVVTPDGVPVAERQMILNSAASELGTIRNQRNCDETAPVVTASEVLSQPEEPVAPATSIATPATVPSGQYLQVATFESAQNRDAALAALRAKGVSANAQPVTLGGRVHHRIIIGPLRNRADIAKADAAASSLGLNDGFFTSG